MTTWSLGLASGAAPLAAFSGQFACGVAFVVDEGGLYFSGWEWGVPADGDTGQQQYELWQLCDTSHGLTSVQIPSATTMSGTLTAGARNVITPAAPVPLSAGVPYVAVTRWVAVNGFPFTSGAFASSGASSGPLSAYSDRAGSNPIPFTSNLPQGLFVESATLMPTQGDSSANFGIGPIITDQAPAGASYVLWPSQPAPINWALDTADNFTLATELALDVPSVLNAIGYFSPPSSVQLATDCGLWDIATEQLVPGTHNAAPAWSGVAGSGFVECAYDGTLVLPAGTGLIKSSVGNMAGSVPLPWSAETLDYWSSGPGGSGISNGPLSAPGVATAAPPGQSTYNLGATFAYPGTFNAPSAGANYWVYARVTPVTVLPGGWDDRHHRRSYMRRLG